MKDNKYKPRKKAFIGAIIGAATSIAGGIIGAKKKKKAARAEARRQEAIKRNEAIYKSTEAMNAGLAGQEDLQQNFMEQYMKYGGSTKTNIYKDRKKKAIGGLGEIIGGVIGGASNIVGAVTENPQITSAGNAIGSVVGQGITNHTNKRLAEQKQAKLEQEAQNGEFPTNAKYGGRHMTLIAGSKGVKVKPRRV